MSDPRWLKLNTVLLIHADQVSLHGGSAEVRDPGLLESALARPRNLFAYQPDADLPALAAAYAYGIVRNHPFVDGNKRAAFAACLTFLFDNGLEFKCDKAEAAQVVLRLAAGELDEDSFASWLRAHSEVTDQTE